MSLVVVANNFDSFVASLKSNLKLGYGICTKMEKVDEYFRAELAKGNDPEYKTKLEHLSIDSFEDSVNNVAQVVQKEDAAKIEEDANSVGKPIADNTVTIKKTRSRKK